MTGGGIRIDVERIAVLADADRRDHRYDVGAGEVMQDLRVDPFRLPDEAKIENTFDVGIRIRFGAVELAGLDQSAVLAGEADGAAAGAVDRGDDLFVD